MSNINELLKRYPPLGVQVPTHLQRDRSQSKKEESLTMQDFLPAVKQEEVKGLAEIQKLSEMKCNVCGTPAKEFVSDNCPFGCSFLVDGRIFYPSMR